MNQFTKTAIASLFTLSSAGVWASAFQLAEVSTSGLGTAYAGAAAVADNASVIATNPALMTQFKNIEVSAGAIYIDADINVKGTNTVTTINPQTGLPVSVRGDATANNVIPVATVPNFYFVVPVNDRFAFGGGINVNYGLKSEFDKNYNAGIFGGKTDLSAINYNLSGAVNLGYGFSFGAGLNVVHSEATVSRYVGNASQLLKSRLPSIENGTTVSHLKGDKWSAGWNAGLSYDFNERNRIGIAYHSAVDVKFKGDFSNDLPLAARGTAGNTIPGALTLNLPAYWEVSTYHKLTDKLALQFSYKRTEWSRFKELEAKGANGVQLFHKDENFSDASRVALGASYDINEALTVRAGIAHDENASVNTPSISIPDTDRTWYSLGATYRFTPNLSVDVAYAHLRGSKHSFTEEQTASVGKVSGQFETRSKANLYGLNLNYKF